MQNSPTCVREGFTAKTEIAPPRHRPSRGQCVPIFESHERKHERRPPRYQKEYVGTSSTQFFPKKKLAGAAPTKNRRKNKKMSRRGAPPKKRLRSRSPTFFSNPALPSPPPRLGAIAHACTQINQAHAGTLTHATTKHGLRGSALRALAFGGPLRRRRAT